jgi:hypothetical protein
MVIGIFFLFTMAVNCFLFIFRGNANSGKTPEAVIWSQVQYMVIATVCQAPVMALVVLLFKKSSPKRPALEDRWIGYVGPRHHVPRAVRKAVACREAQLQASTGLRHARADLVASKRLLRSEV